MSENTTMVVSTRLTSKEIAKLDKLAAAAGVTKAHLLRLLVAAVDEVNPPQILVNVRWHGGDNDGQN